MSGHGRVWRWVCVAVLFSSVACGDDESTGPEQLEFTCENVANGASLSGTATVTDMDVEVIVRSNNGRFSQAPVIDELSSGNLGEVIVKSGEVHVPITSPGNSASFDLDGRLIGPSGLSCPVTRSFTVTVSGDSATVQ